MFYISVPPFYLLLRKRDCQHTASQVSSFIFVLNFDTGDPSTSIGLHEGLYRSFSIHLPFFEKMPGAQISLSGRMRGVPTYTSISTISNSFPRSKFHHIFLYSIPYAVHSTVHTTRPWIYFCHRFHILYSLHYQPVTHPPFHPLRLSYLPTHLPRLEAHIFSTFCKKRVWRDWL